MSTPSVADPPVPADGDEGDPDSTAEKREPAVVEPHPTGVVLRRGAGLSLLAAVVLTLVLEVSTL